MTPPPVIVVLTTFFVPGSRAGGPMRSLDALTSTKQNRVRFNVVTSDRDSGDDAPYQVFVKGDWLEEAGRKVLYLDRESFRSLFVCVREIRKSNPSVYYMNSLWARHFTLLPLVLIGLHILPRRPILLAPRGELMVGAFLSKSLRKRCAVKVYRFVLDWLGITIHATSPEESARVRSTFPGVPTITIGDTFPLSSPKALKRERGRPIRVCYLARIDPHKNLLTAIRAVNSAGVPVCLDVYGSTLSPAYLAECQSAAGSAPPQVQIRFHGHVPNSEVGRRLIEADVYVLPTLSENFGHGIREALASSCIVLTSPHTPWTPLLHASELPTIEGTDHEGYARAIRELALMSDAEFGRRRALLGDAFEEWELTQGGRSELMLEAFERLAGVRG